LVLPGAGILRDMYGEPIKIREVAERLERRASQLRSEADALVAAGERAPWVSLAADRMRAGAAERRADLVGVARDYEEAAAVVRRHAAVVQQRLDLVAEAQRHALRLLDRLGDAVDLPGLPDLPPPGDLGWLAVADSLAAVRS
jgi:methyl-accepting chemotaxis protein